VQLAKHFGAHVTGVSSATSLGLVQSLGADEVLDYRVADFTAIGRTYDVVFDVAGTSSFSRCTSSLNDGGRYLRTVPSLGIVAQTLWTSRFGRKRAVIRLTGLRKSADKRKDLETLMELLDRGRLRAVVGKQFVLEESVAAHRFVERGAKQGSVVLTV
jgi:NADPH:quinone reductase-like Zn-dependent oxidoreductase